MNSNGKLIKSADVDLGSLCIYERGDGTAVIGIAAIDWEGDKVIFDVVAAEASQYDYVNNSDYVFLLDSANFEFEIGDGNFRSIERAQPSQIYLYDFGYLIALKGRFDDRVYLIDLATGKIPEQRPRKLYPVGDWKIVQNLSYRSEPLILHSHQVPEL